MEYQENWYKVKQRLQAFWDREIIDRCCIAVEAPKRGHTLPVETTFEYRGQIPEKDRLKYWTDGEYILNNRITKFEHTFFGGDSFPQIFAELGASGHAGYFKGTQCTFDNSVWFSPWITDPDNQKLEFDSESFLYKKTFELAEYFAAEAKNRYFIAMPDIAGNMDALAHMRGSLNLLLDLYDNREWIKKSLIEIQKVTGETLERYYQTVKDTNENGTCIGWLNTYLEGRHAQMQCDFSVMIGPEDYEELIIPELKEQIKWMDRSLYHLDGQEQLRHLEHLLSLDNLTTIQWTCVAGQPSPVEFIPQLKRIQEAGKCLIIPCFNQLSYIEPLLENLSSKGLMITAIADSQDEAEQIVKLAEKYTHE